MSAPLDDALITSSALGPDCAARPGELCDLVSIGDFPDISGIVGKVEIRRCNHCGHAITFPALPDVAFLYAGRESQDFQPSAKGLSAVIKHAAFGMQARKLLRQLPEIPKSVLDFGCGSGQFTRVLGEVLPRSTVFGSDFHELAPPILSNDSYRPLDQLRSEGRRYDLVIAMHVLEHDDDTRTLLSRIVATVKSGGLIVVEVPNVDCVWAPIFGRNWDAWYTPYHRVHFTRTSLLHQLEAGGLEILAVHDVTVPTLGRTLANCFGSKKNLFWLLAGIVVHPVQWALEKLTGRPSAIRAIARVKAAGS